MLGHYLHVQPWEDDFNSKMNTIASMVVWARLLDVPFYLYNRRVLKAVGGLLGRVISLDYQTDACSQGKYARNAVELDLTKPIPTKMRVEGTAYPMIYENVSLNCFNCGFYGHLQHDCPVKVRPQEE